MSIKSSGQSSSGILLQPVLSWTVSSTTRFLWRSMAPATGNTKANCCKKSMEKRRKTRLKSKKRDKSNPVTHREQKALTIVGAFCLYSNLHVIRKIGSEVQLNISNEDSSKIVACFKSKSAIENLHRNNEKTPLGNAASNQQNRRVGSKCSI